MAGVRRLIRQTSAPIRGDSRAAGQGSLRLMPCNGEQAEPLSGRENRTGEREWCDGSSARQIPIRLGRGHSRASDARLTSSRPPGKGWIFLSYRNPAARCLDRPPRCCLGSSCEERLFLLPQDSRADFGDTAMQGERVHCFCRQELPPKQRRRC